MTPINKLPASAGAQWLLDAFALLRRAPWGLGRLGVIWGALTLLALAGGALHPTLGLALQLGLSLLGPFLFAGLLWAVREVDGGRPVQPGVLFHEIRGEHASALLATFLPQLLMALGLALLFLTLVGTDGMQQMVEVAGKIQAAQAAGQQPDPALVQALPVGRVLLCLLVALAMVPVVVFLIFVAVPQVIFSGSQGLAAMRTSLRACLHNLPALLVFLLLLFVTLLALTVGVQIVAMVLQLLLGTAFAVFVANLLMMAVLMPLFAGVTYFAWKQMFGAPEQAAAAPALPPDRIEL